MRRRGTRYRNSTIRTHIVSRLCRDAPAHHGTVYDDLERIGDGVYQRLPDWQSRPALPASRRMMA